MFCTSIGLLLYVLALSTLSHAFRLLTPNTTSPFSPVTVSWKRRDSDPQSWNLNVSRPDGTQATVLEEGIFSNGKKGTVQTKIPFTGSLVLKAVNPSNPDEAYARTDSFMVIDTGTSVANEGAPPPPEGKLNSAPAEPATDSSGDATPIGTSTELPQSTSTTSIPSSTVSRIPIIVGAAVGAVVLLLAIVAVTLLVYRRRVRSRPTTFYRERMVRQRDPEGPGPLSPTSSFAALVPRSPPHMFYAGRMREKGEEESILSFSTSEKR